MKTGFLEKDLGTRFNFALVCAAAMLGDGKSGGKERKRERWCGREKEEEGGRGVGRRGRKEEGEEEGEERKRENSFINRLEIPKSFMEVSFIKYVFSFIPIKKKKS